MQEVSQEHLLVFSLLPPVMFVLSSVHKAVVKTIIRVHLVLNARVCAHEAWSLPVTQPGNCFMRIVCSLSIDVLPSVTCPPMQPPFVMHRTKTCVWVGVVSYSKTSQIFHPCVVSLRILLTMMMCDC